MKHKKNNNSKNKTRKRLKKLASPKFSLAAPKIGARNFGAGLQPPPPPPPIAPLARTSPVRKLKRISSSSSNYVVLTF